jgi:hypothetical protein
MVYIIQADDDKYRGSCFFLQKSNQYRLYTAQHVIYGAYNIVITINSLRVDLSVDNWNHSLEVDISFLEQKHFPDEIHLNEVKCYDFCNVPRDNEFLSIDLMGRVPINMSDVMLFMMINFFLFSFLFMG